MQEVAIQTNTFSVENGRGSSVQVAITTKSGSNDYRGTGSYFFTNEQLRARTLFTTQYEPFSRHDMSATFGGPIKKEPDFLLRVGAAAAIANLAGDFGHHVRDARVRRTTPTNPPEQIGTSS